MSGTWISEEGSHYYEMQVRMLSELLNRALTYLDEHPEHRGMFDVQREEDLYSSQKKRLI